MLHSIVNCSLRTALLVALVIISPLSLAESTATSASAKASSTTAAAKSTSLDIYKSPTCGCCTLWVDHLTENGFSSKIHHPDDLTSLKQKYRIAPQYQSCHTAVSPEGYVFEGHIPARIIKRFLGEKPEGAIGLAVPNMPVGSPGMEMGERFSPYDVLLLKADGSSEVYTRITKLED